MARRVTMSRYRAPNAEDVQAALLKIPTVQLRRAFYEGLNNPLWVRPLFEARAFTTPPEPQKMDDGYIRDVYWPEISYLVRIAPRAPGDVVDVLLGLKDSNNAWVRRAVFEIGSKIPAVEGARLRPLLDAWKTTGFGWRTDPRDSVSFAITLLEGGEAKTGRWLANNLFEPRAAKDDGTFKKPQLELEDYWYEEELPRLAPALGDDALKAVAAWLVKYERLSGHVADDHDFSGIARPSIRDRDDSYASPEHSLIEAVRDLAIPAILKNPESAAGVLLGSKVQLLRKIAMYGVAEAIRRRTSDGADAKYLMGVAEQLLGDNSSDDEYLRVDYAELAQAVAKVDPSVVGVINTFIANAYAQDLKRIRERLTDEDASAEDAEAEVKVVADRYKHSWLSAIGADALPPQARTELSELDSKYGVIENPLTRLGLITSWTGPNPHSTQDEMAAMSPSELVAHLASWHDTGDGWGPQPSHEGQGRELSALLTTNPLAISGATDLVQQFRPTYLRAVLQGWEAALKADIELDWAQVAGLIRDVLAHDNESSFPVEGGNHDDDKDFRWAKKAAVGLLEELVKKRKAVTIPDESMAGYADLLIKQAADDDAWTEYDTYESGENGWDPLTMSVNWQWPNRLRGLFYLATRSKDAPWKQAAFAAIEAELARADKHGAGRAVIGENLGRLLNDSPDWLEVHLEEFVGSRDGISISQQIVLTTAIATHYYHRDLYDLLSGSMIASIGVGDSLVAGWRSESDPLKRIGEWAIDALIYGHKSFDDPLAQVFFSSTSTKVRGEAIGHIAWSFFRAEKVDDAIRDRFARLWDERVAHVQTHPEDSGELTGFYWFAKGGKFTIEWWLPRMREALELEPGIATERYMIGKELAEASAVDPKNALAVLRLLLGGREEGGMVSYDLTRNAAAVVIAHAISSGDDDLKREADAYMNELGAKGNLGLEAEVKAVLDGTITQNDVGD